MFRKINLHRSQRWPEPVPGYPHKPGIHSTSPVHIKVLIIRRLDGAKKWFISIFRHVPMCSVRNNFSCGVKTVHLNDILLLCAFHHCQVTLNMAAVCVITKVGENLTTPVRSTISSHTKNSRELLESLRLSVMWKQSLFLW